MKIRLDDKSKIIIGLGNPGKNYEKTYHNVGFLAVDFLAKNLLPPLIKKIGRRDPANGGTNSKFQIPRLRQGFGGQANSKKFKFYKLGGKIFIKPLTFMNDSGKAVLAVIKYFKVRPEEILVIHDDSDIDLGGYKISFARGSAGHRGVQSIIESLGTKNFWRLRLGIRKKSRRKTKAADLVLKKINKDDFEILDKVFQKSETDLMLNPHTN